MDCTANILMALIKSQITAQPLDETAARLEKTDLPALYKLAKMHDMAHLAGAAIRRNGLPAGEYADKFRSHTLDAAYRSEKIAAALTQTSTWLEQAQIPFILLKGTVIRQMYPENWMRTSCDIDVLVKPDDAAGALELLCAQGYTRKPDTSAHDYVLIAPNGVAVELHHTLTQDDCVPGTDETLESVWLDAQPKTNDSWEYQMSNELFWVYHLAHMARHFLHGGCGVRPFADLWLMGDKMPCDREKLETLLEKTKLVAFYTGVMALTDVWFGGMPHNQSTRQMEQFILSGGVYGTYTNAAAVNAGQGQSKLRSFLRMMFLPRKDLQVLYPELEKHPGLYPCYQMKRWCGIFSKDRRANLKDRTNARNAVTADQKTAATEMLRALGLDTAERK